MVRIGIIGIGFMGMIHYYGIQKVLDGKVTAICTRNPKKLAGDWTSIQGNFGPRGSVENLSEIKTYDHIDAILADPEIDLIDICLPTHYHKDVTISALKSGKHVLVEKPIAIDLDSANEMTRTADETGNRLMVAHVLPFFPEFSYALETVKNVEYGELLGANLKRITSKSADTPSAADVEKSGGPGIDLHIHDTHFIQLLNGMPDAVFSQGKLIGDKYTDYLTTQYIYRDNPVTISCSSGSISQKGRAFSHGFEIFLEKATLLFESSTLGGQPVVSQPLTIITDRGKVEQVDLGDTDPVGAFTDEIQHAVNAINTNSDAVLLSGDKARDALLLCYKEAESVRTGQVIAVG